LAPLLHPEHLIDRDGDVDPVAVGIGVLEAPARTDDEQLGPIRDELRFFESFLWIAVFGSPGSFSPS
jgi:hypothetical protein